VPTDHPLRALDTVVNFERTRTVLAEYYSHTGRPSIDPELMLRMLLIGYAYGKQASDPSRHSQRKVMQI
jgi:transposase